MSNKLASLRRDLEHIRRHRAEIIQQKSRLATRLSDLNKDLKSKKIPYENYESKFKYLLGGKSVEEKKKYFKKRLVAIKHREKDLLSRIKHETHASKNKTKLITVTAAMFIIFAPIIGLNLIELTGMGTYIDAPVDSYVEVQSWLAASISYSTVTFSGGTPGEILNASLNYDISASTTGYYLNYSTDSNVANTNLCINGTNLIDGSNSIAIGNVNVTAAMQTNNINTPARSASAAITTSSGTLQTGLDPGENSTHRYWMDLPSTSPTGEYEGSFNLTIKSSTC